jgi:hypothetical protein
VTNGTDIPTADIDDGKLRYIHSGVSNDQLSFSVNDGLVFSNSPNIATFIPVTQTQSITFLNPGNKTPNQTIASSATASSGLTVTLSSSTPGVCTVSGLDIVLTGTVGTCTIVANQAGNGSYASAPSVTQSFQVSAVVVNYTLTYNGNSQSSGLPPANQVGSGSITIQNNSGNLTNTGFNFGGWLINGVTYAPGAIYNLSADATATAVWTEVVAEVSPPTMPASNSQPTPALARTGFASGEYLMLVLLFLVISGSGLLVFSRRLELKNSF